MAIDTAEKRRAAAGVRRGPRVTPNVAKDAQWRYQAGRSYSGIVADGASERTGNKFALVSIGQMMGFG